MRLKGVLEAGGGGGGKRVGLITKSDLISVITLLCLCFRVGDFISLSM